MYFKYFKDFNYTLDNKEYSFVDIFKRVAFSKDTLNNKKVFSDHYVVDGESLESLALKYYNDASMSWLILLANSFVSSDEFPQSMESIEKKAAEKYSGYAIYFGEYIPNLKPGDVIVQYSGNYPNGSYVTNNYAIITEYNSFLRCAIVKTINGTLLGGNPGTKVGFIRLTSTGSENISFQYTQTATSNNIQTLYVANIKKIDEYKNTVNEFVDIYGNYRSPYYINDLIDANSNALSYARSYDSTDLNNSKKTIGYTQLGNYMLFNSEILSTDGTTKGTWQETWGHRYPAQTPNAPELPSSPPAGASPIYYTPGGGITYTGSSIIISTKPQTNYYLGGYGYSGNGRAELRNEQPFQTPSTPTIKISDYNWNFSADVQVNKLVKRNISLYDYLKNGRPINTEFNKIHYIVGFYRTHFNANFQKDNDEYYFGPQVERLIGFINHSDDLHWAIGIISQNENSVLEYVVTDKLLTDRHTFQIKLDYEQQNGKFYIDGELLLETDKIISDATMVHNYGAMVRHGLYDSSTTSAEMTVYSMNSIRNPMTNFITNKQKYISDNNKNRIIKILKPKYIPVVRGAIQELITSDEIKTKVIEIVG